MVDPEGNTAAAFAAAVVELLRSLTQAAPAP
jgi:hypothetical protein